MKTNTTISRILLNTLLLLIIAMHTQIIMADNKNVQVFVDEFYQQFDGMDDGLARVTLFIKFDKAVPESKRFDVMVSMLDRAVKAGPVKDEASQHDKSALVIKSVILYLEKLLFIIPKDGHLHDMIYSLVSHPVLDVRWVLLNLSEKLKNEDRISFIKMFLSDPDNDLRSKALGKLKDSKADLLDYIEKNKLKVEFKDSVEDAKWWLDNMEKAK